MKKFVVIVAGGSGSRMNNTVPKQFLQLKGKPVLYHTINAFFTAYEDINVILVLPADHINTGQEIINTYFNRSAIAITTGGATRFHSVQNGLKLVDNDSIVFVHDAVRCMVSHSLIHRCYDAVLQYGSAVPAIASKDSLRILTDTGSEPLQRDHIKLIQTPQVFMANELQEAFNVEYSDRFTDEATVMENAGMNIHLVDGDENNFKITVPTDMLMAEKIMDEGIL